jgi:hypothetical protein
LEEARAGRLDQAADLAEQAIRTQRPAVRDSLVAAVRDVLIDATDMIPAGAEPGVGWSDVLAERIVAAMPSSDGGEREAPARHTYDRRYVPVPDAPQSSMLDVAQLPANVRVALREAREFEEQGAAWPTLLADPVRAWFRHHDRAASSSPPPAGEGRTPRERTVIIPRASVALVYGERLMHPEESPDDFPADRFEVVCFRELLPSAPGERTAREALDGDAMDWSGPLGDAAEHWQRNAARLDSAGDRLYRALALVDRRDGSDLAHVIRAAREGWERSDMAEPGAFDEFDARIERFEPGPGLSTFAVEIARPSAPGEESAVSAIDFEQPIWDAYLTEHPLADDDPDHWPQWLIAASQAVEDVLRRAASPPAPDGGQTADACTRDARELSRRAAHNALIQAKAPRERRAELAHVAADAVLRALDIGMCPVAGWSPPAPGETEAREGAGTPRFRVLASGAVLFARGTSAEEAWSRVLPSDHEDFGPLRIQQLKPTGRLVPELAWVDVPSPADGAREESGQHG